jgi:hypothetical protein
MPYAIQALPTLSVVSVERYAAGSCRAEAATIPKLDLIHVGLAAHFRSNRTRKGRVLVAQSGVEGVPGQNAAAVPLANITLFVVLFRHACIVTASPTTV